MSDTFEKLTKDFSKMILSEKKEPEIRELSSYLQKFKDRRGKANPNIKVTKLLPEIKDKIKDNFSPENVSHATEKLDRLDQAEIITQENILEFLIKQVIIHRLDIEGMEISELLKLFRTTAGFKKTKKKKKPKKKPTKKPTKKKKPDKKSSKKKK